jgi:hypothetical protein
MSEWLVRGLADIGLRPFSPERCSEKCTSLGRLPGGARKRGIDRKAVAVLHQDVAHEAQPALAAVGLAVEPRVGIGGELSGAGRITFEAAISVAGIGDLLF